MRASRLVAVTGASGMIGRHLCEHFLHRGWRVRALMRNPDASAGSSRLEQRRIDLPESFPDDALAGVDVVVHAAYATQEVGHAAAHRVNVVGSRLVVEGARRAGARVVFLSSLSAHARALSLYGTSKRTVEMTMDPDRDLVVRPGLVLAADGGLALRMWRTVARAAVVPLFDGGTQHTQTIHVDDLCVGIGNAIEAETAGLLTLAESDGITMRGLLTLFARSVGKRPRFLSLPSGPSLSFLRLVESTGLPLPVSSENLLGLMSMTATEASSSAIRVGVRVRSSSESVENLAPIVRALLGRRA